MKKIHDLIGIPFTEKGFNYDGCDCFALVYLFYRDIMGIEITKHKSNFLSTRNIVREYILESNTNWEVVSSPQMGDVVAMARDGKHPNVIQHFGVMIDNNKILHTLDNVGSHITDLEKEKYFIKAIHRWRN